MSICDAFKLRQRLALRLAVLYVSASCFSIVTAQADMTLAIAGADAQAACSQPRGGHITAEDIEAQGLFFKQ